MKMIHTTGEHLVEDVQLLFPLPIRYPRSNATEAEDVAAGEYDPANYRPEYPRE